MRLFKRTALQQHQQEIISPFYQTTLEFERTRSNTLTHVMNLFEETRLHLYQALYPSKRMVLLW
jgi:hypothetical protein